MYETILKSLKTKYSSLGLSLAILVAMAKTLEPQVTEESQVETAVAGVEGLLKAFQPELDTHRNAKAEAERKLKELQEKGGGPTQPPKTTETKTEDGEVPEWAKSILESNKELKNELSKLQSEKVVGSRKQVLNELIKTLPENLQKPYNRIDLSSKTDDDFTAFMEEVKGDVEETLKELKASGVRVTPPGSGSGDPNPTAATDDELKAAREAAGV